MTRFLRPGRLMIYALIIRFLFSKLGGSTIDYNNTITIKEGQSLSQTSLYDELGFMEKYALKSFLKENNDEVKKIQVGSYVFSGSYAHEELLQVFLDGPVQTYNNITILEGWSSYDIDAHLSAKGLAETGEYRSFITDQTIIGRYGERYAFIGEAIKEKGSIPSLEGYLYPSTFYVDPDLDVIDQLVYLQLEEFKKNIWEQFGDKVLDLNTYLQSQGYGFTLSTYGAITLASVIEKEERVPANRVKIASVFYNRLNDGMRIDADITLCYGLKMTHKECTPRVIGNNVHDGSNSYNTRAVGGLPPTPISGVTKSSVEALVLAKKTNNYFYLHDSSGNIHVSKNLLEHNQNKSKYID